MGGEAGEALEHFVAGDAQDAFGEKEFPEDRGGHRVGVEHGPGPGFREGGVKERLGAGREPCFTDRGTVPINEEELIWRETALVKAAAGHEQSERGPVDDDAVVAARAERPAAAVEIASGHDEIGDFGGKGIGHGHGERIGENSPGSTPGLTGSNGSTEAGCRKAPGASR